MEGEDQKSNINSMDVKKAHKPLKAQFPLPIGGENPCFLQMKVSVVKWREIMIQ